MYYFDLIPYQKEDDRQRQTPCHNGSRERPTGSVLIDKGKKVSS